MLSAIRAVLAAGVGRGLRRNADFYRSAGLVAGGTVIAQAIALLSSPLLTRLYRPEDFGAVAVYGSLLGMLVVVASMRYEVAIPLPRSSGMGFQLLVLSLAATVVLAGLTGVIVAMWGEAVTRGLGAPQLAPYMWLLPLGLFGGGTYKALSYWAIRTNDYDAIARTKVGQSFGQAAVQIGLGLYAAGPFGLIVGQVTGQTLGVGSLARLAWRGSRKAFSSVTTRRLHAAARRYRRFPLISAPAAVVNAGGLLLPPVLVAVFYGPVVAGLFALVKRITDVPTRMVGTAAAQAFLGHASGLANDPVRLRRLSRDVVLSLMALGLLPFVLLVLTAPPLFELIFGAAWREAGVFAQWLALPLLLQFATAPCAQLFNVVGRQDLHLKWNVVRLMLVGAALLGAGLLGFGALEAVVAYAATTAASYVLLIAMLRQATTARTTA